MLKEGKLKVIKSDMRRAREDRNSVKDLRNVEVHMNDHKKLVNKDMNMLLEKDPKAASKLRMTSVMPIEQPVSAFASPTRAQL